MATCRPDHDSRGQVPFLLALLVVLATVAAPVQAVASATPPDLDLRANERAPVSRAEREARRDLAVELGALGEVRVDRGSGGVAYVGRADRLLTGPSTRTARDVVLGYVRAHHEVFGLDDRDLANLRLVARSVSPEGIVHLRFNQTLRGIRSFDSGIEGHVTADGRLINVSGAPAPGARLTDVTPSLGARAGLREARRAVAGRRVLPSTSEAEAAPGRTTEFVGGERAVLRWSVTADGPRLAWSVIAADAEDGLHDVLVDAESGALLRRQSLTSELGRARYFPVDPLLTPDQVEITMPPEWYDDHGGGTRLWGEYSRTYVDGSNENPAPGDELGGDRVQVPASDGAPAEPDWTYGQTAFPEADPCPPTPAACTWDGTQEGSSEVNQLQAATNAHVLVSRFHDHLEQAPIGFDEASGNFQRTNQGGQGLGEDYVRTEVNDVGGRNNANFATPPDGIAPRMQLYLFNRYYVNASDMADVVYHEYAHGLSNRLVVNASGGSALSGFQSRMMGEGWSDFFALDLLVHEGRITDTSAFGEVTIGVYGGGPGGIRSKPIDCPVDPGGAVAACNGTPDLVAPIIGGYTYGDIVPLYALLLPPPYAPLYYEGPHNGGEIWAQTLWDIRTALGRETALALITGGMRLSADDPSMLDMRDSILQQAVAMRSAPGAADDYYEELWEIFRKRGMGADASTPSSSSTVLSEGFGLLVAAGPATFTDPYPAGDNDGKVEPGEQFEIRQRLRSVAGGNVAAFDGSLLSGAGGTIVDGTASWPALDAGLDVENEDPLIARLGPGCTSAVPMTLSTATETGPAKVRYRFDKRPGSSDAIELADASGDGPGVTAQSIQVAGEGIVSDVDLRIGELSHPRLDELRVELIHDGVSAVIFDGVPWTGQEMIDMTFDSDSANPTFAVRGPGTMTGRAQPQPVDALDAFDGRPVAGSWTLRITDSVPGTRGELRRWGIDSPQQSCPGRLEIPDAEAAAATGIGQEAAILNGSVTPNGRQTGLRFAFGETDAYGETSEVTAVGAGDEPVGATHGLTDLEPGTTYHYRVEAIREQGQVAVVSADRTFTTESLPEPDPPDPPDPPTPPAGPEPPSPPEPPNDPPPEIGDARVKLLTPPRRKTPRRVVFLFRISEPARVTVEVKKVVRGVRKRKRCAVVPKRRRRSGRQCTRRLLVARRTAERDAGRGRLGVRASTFGRGRFVARLTAVDQVGSVSEPTVVRFAIRRRTATG